MRRAGAQRLRVQVTDDHPLYRESLARAIRGRPELELVGEASDGRHALEQIRELEPDVAMLDVELPELSGLQVLNAVIREGLETRVLLLSGRAAGEAVYEAISTGAGGFLLKVAGGEVICDAIAAVARGETVLAPELQTGLAGELRLRAEPDERPALSSRERDVLRLLAEGLTAPSIARQLHLGTSTVKTHLQSLYRKLGVSDRAAAVAEAMRRGLLD